MSAVEPDPDFIATVVDFWARSDASDSSYERGQILEELVRYVFGSIPGLSHWRSRHVTNNGDAEFDVCFSNDIRQSPFPFAEPAMVVECKNTGGPIGSGDVRNFIAKMQEVQLSWAFLVAANGITGSGERNSHAHAVIQGARGRGINVLVITRAELEALPSAQGFAELVREKIMLHTLNAPLF